MSDNASGEGPLLECTGITVRFGGLEALSDLSLCVRAGEVLGIAGPNGAGKTTLFNVISGHVRPAKGTVFLKGKDITHLRPDRIFHSGIARTFQIPELIGTQTVYANVLVGAHFSRDRSVATALTYADSSYQATEKALKEFDLEGCRGKVAANASLYERKLIMLASAMAGSPQVLLLDEPVSGLSAVEADAFLSKVKDVRRGGTTVVIIEHVMRVLMAVADRLVILHRGRIMYDGKPEDAKANEDVQRLYLGKGNGVRKHGHQ